VRLLSKSDLRTISSILAVVLLIASAPSTAGLALVAGPNHPELTVNVCRPIQSFDRAANILLARPAPIIIEHPIGKLVPVTAEAPVRIDDCISGPEPPPPKQLI
jgi:hypothetical protein